MKLLYCPRNGKQSSENSFVSPETDPVSSHYLPNAVGIGYEEVMKKSLLTSSILATFTLLNTSTAHAETRVEIDEHILVTANRSQQEQFTALSANQIITKDDIARMQVVSVTDLLQSVAGINITNQGDAGQQSSVYTRGTNSNHTLILVDGVRIGSATLGTTSFANMSVQQIERIEVVKGPRAALYGSDAIGGVIQIFTKKFANGEGDVTAGIGSNGLYQGAASLGFGTEAHQYTVNVSTEDADGFNAYTSDPDDPYDINEPDEDGYSRQSISVVGTNQITDELAINLVGRFEENTSDYDASYPDTPCWGDPSSSCPSFYPNQSASENYHLKMNSVYAVDDFSVEFSFAKSQDKATTYGNGIEKNEGNAIATDRDQASVVAHYSLAEKIGVTAGLDWYQESVSASGDLDPWTPNVQSWVEEERIVQAVFVQANHQVESFLFEGAIRYDDIENVGNETTYNLSAGYQLADNLLISLNTGTGFKAATFNDLYWPGSGNAALRPESSKTHEVLVRHRGDNSLVELSIYDTEVEELIAWSPNATGMWQPANINQASMSGVDASFEFTQGDFDYQVALAYVDTEDKSTGDELLRRPKFTIDYSINYHLDEWQFGAVARFRDKAADSNNSELDDYWLIDLSSSYQVTEQFTLSAKVANLFDKQSQSALNYKADGTNYRISASYSF